MSLLAGTRLRDWIPEFADAACEGVDANVFFTSQEAARRAKLICSSCPALLQCREWGLAYEEFGVWGGLDEYERRAIRKDRGIRMRVRGGDPA